MSDETENLRSGWKPGQSGNPKGHQGEAATASPSSPWPRHGPCETLHATKGNNGNQTEETGDS